MKITTYKVDNYRGCPVYYRGFNQHFEYLTILKKQLYTAHIAVRPGIIPRLIYLLGFAKSPYTENQTKAILKQLRLLAESTIDTILNKRNKL